MFFITLTVLTLVLVLIYITSKYNENYWTKRGVKFYEKHKVIGMYWDFFTKREPLFRVFHGIYKEYPNEPAVGIGTFFKPSLYVRDPLNIQHVLASDFQSFNHRGTVINPRDVLADNILFMNGTRWKLVRQSMSPLFTSAKLKNMFYIIDKSAEDFVMFLKDNPDKLNSDTFNTLTYFCNAAISSAVFGIGSKSIFESPFLEMARQSFKPSLSTNVKFATATISSYLFKLLDLRLFNDQEDFFVNAMKKVIGIREKEASAKHDFVDLCVGLKKNGYLKDSVTGLEIEVTDELLAAQGFFFFIAGIEPAATGIFATLVELGRHSEILELVHKEIDEVLNKHDGKLTYDNINEIVYLDSVMSEAFRMYPPIGYLTRECVQDTVLPVGNIKVDKGTKLFTPIYEMHYDPKYFPNPENFDPERFSTESDHKDVAYMPFGKGNRTCLGLRYARLQVKAGLVHLLRNYTLKTVVHNGGIKYKHDPVQVRIENVDVQFIQRNQ